MRLWVLVGISDLAADETTDLCAPLAKRLGQSRADQTGGSGDESCLVVHVFWFGAAHLSGWVGCG
jgi:hypothetical protein